MPGVAAQGRASFTGPRGERSVAITVEAAAGGGCRVRLAQGGRALEAVASGRRASVTGPAQWARALPLPLDPRLGCALLPRSGPPSSLAWRFRGRPATVAYNGQTVRVSVEGSVRLAITYTAVTRKEFDPADFALPPPPKNFPHRKAPGGGPGGGPGGEQ